MALCARLCGSRSLGLIGQSGLPVSLCRKITIVPQPATPPIEESHDARNMRLNRPQSPHLTIYKPQITSMLSITHRFTGLGLSAYVSAIGITSLVANKPVGELIQSLQTLDPTILAVAKIILIFPFTYHFTNGIRHLIWDQGKGLTIKGVYSTGYVMVAASILSAALLFLL